MVLEFFEVVRDHALLESGFLAEFCHVKRFLPQSVDDMQSAVVGQSAEEELICSGKFRFRVVA